MISGTDELAIIKATPLDVENIKQIADAHKKELGFVRRPSLLESIDRAEVFVAKKNSTMLGFVEYRHRRDQQTTLYNIAVVPEYRDKGIGRKLLEALINEAKLFNKSRISLKCPEDLAANKFYESLGFYLHNVEPGKRRKLNIWQRMV